MPKTFNWDVDRAVDPHPIFFENTGNFESSAEKCDVITFPQQNLAENLQKQGGFVPGIRPGRPTQEYINKVLVRITFAGAFFLGFVAVVPFLSTEFIPDSSALTLSSTGLLIVVGVALDTMKQIESQLLMRNYEGFIR